MPVLRFLLQVNWHALWQSLVLLLIVGWVSRALSARQYSPRIRRVLWLVVLFSPIALPVLFLLANVVGWGVPWERLSVWYYIKTLLYDPLVRTVFEPGGEPGAVALFVQYGVMGLYLLLAGSAAFLMTREMVCDARLLRESFLWRMAPEDTRAYQRLSVAMGVPKVPSLRSHRREARPSVIGLLSVVIMMPIRHVVEQTEWVWDRLLRDSVAFRCILAHELAHIRCRDHLVRFLRGLATVVLPFPMILLRAAGAFRHLVENTEACCDLLAVQHGRIDGQRYGEVIRMAYGSRQEQPPQAVSRRWIVHNRGSLLTAPPAWAVAAILIGFATILPPMAGSGSLIDAIVNKVPAVKSWEFRADIGGRAANVSISAENLAAMDLGELRKLRSQQFASMDEHLARRAHVTYAIPSGPPRTSVSEFPNADWYRRGGLPFDPTKHGLDALGLEPPRNAEWYLRGGLPFDPTKSTFDPTKFLSDDPTKRGLDWYQAPRNADWYRAPPNADSYRAPGLLFDPTKLQPPSPSPVPTPGVP